jgi:hypothetical protein
MIKWSTVQKLPTRDAGITDSACTNIMQFLHLITSCCELHPRIFPSLFLDQNPFSKKQFCRAAEHDASIISGSSSAISEFQAWTTKLLRWERSKTVKVICSKDADWVWWNSEDISIVAGNERHVKMCSMNLEAVGHFTPAFQSYNTT